MAYFIFKKKHLIALFIGVSSTSIISCAKFVEVSPPETSVAGESVFKNNDLAVSAVAGLYFQFMSVSPNFLNGALSIYAGLSADEIINTTASTTYDPFATNTLNSSNTVVQSSFWISPYQYIYQTNAILEGLSNSQEVTDSINRQLTGEVKFFRALIYFYMVNLYGDVPLITTSDYRANNTIARTVGTTVYQQMILDLTDAQSLLPVNYVTTSSYSSARVRVNKWAATALLARVYLYNKDYINAEAQASAVINSGVYNLETDLKKVFLNTSREAILQFLPVSTSFNTSEGNIFIPTSTTVKPTFVLTNDLLNAFEANDQRKANWTSTNSIVVSGITTNYTFPAKYKVKTASAYTEYNMILRLAEQYLIRAEARARQNTNLVGAITDINIIRTRAGLSTLPVSLTQSQILDAIEKERRVELFSELGHRWLDLKRTGRIDNVLGSLKGSTWKSTAALFPIPIGEITKNPALEQNVGY